MSSEAQGPATNSPWIGRMAVVLLALALPLAGQAYFDQQRGDGLPWWQWVVELVAAVAMVNLALSDEYGRTSEESAGRRWLRRGLLLGSLGVLAAAVQSAAVLGAELRTGILIVLSLVLFFCGRWQPLRAVDVARTFGAEKQPLPPLAGRSRGLFVVAALCVAAAMGVNEIDHLGALALWIVGLVLLAAGARLSDRGVETEPAAASAIEGLSPRLPAFLFLLVMLVALLLRFAQIADVPVLVDPDEGRHGAWAVRIWREGIPDFFAFGWNSFPNLAYVAEYALIPLIGQSYVALRYSAATFGTLSVVLTFFWVRRWWGPVAGFLAAFLLAINQEHLYWSRVGFNNIHSAAVAALLMLAFVRVLQRGRWLDYVLFGYAVGAGWYTYHAAKLFPALLLAPCAILAVALPGLLRRHFAGVLTSVYALALLVAPQATWIYRNFEMFQRDTMNRFDFQTMVEAYGQGNFVEVRRHLESHVLHSLYVFLSVPYKLSLFEVWVAVPFLLGIGYMAWRWRDPRNLVVLAWIGGQLVIGSMLTGYPPNKPRLVGMIPIACVVPAVLVAAIYQRLRSSFGARSDWLTVPLLGGWLALAAYSNWYTQFVYMAGLHRADSESFMLRKVTSLPLPATVYMLGTDASLSPAHALSDGVTERPSMLTLVNPGNDPDVLPLPPSPAGHVLILVSRFQKELAPVVRYFYPDAPEEVVRSTDGADLLYAFSFDSGALVKVNTLRSTYRQSNGEVATRTIPIGSEQTVLYPADDLAFPVDAVWEGQVYIADPGRYSFRAVGARLRVGWGAGAAVGDEVGPIEMAGGWHPIRIEAPLASARDHIDLTWRGSDGAWMPVSRRQLSSHPRPLALRGRYFAPGPDGPPERLMREQLHPAIAFEWQIYDDDDPPAWFFPTGSRAEWSGTVDIPLEEQPLQLQASVPARVYLGDRLVLETRGDNEQGKATTTLHGLHGRVPIRIEATRPVAAYSPYWKLRLLWGTPGGSWTALADYRPD